MCFSAHSRGYRYDFLCICLLASLSWSTCASAATDMEAGKAREPIRIESSAALSFTARSEASLQGIPGSWKTVSRLEPENALSESARQAAITAGDMGLLVLQDGTHLIDSSGKCWRATSPTSLDVRPREIVHQAASGTVWFYGEGLYRYRMAGRVLEKFQTAAEGMGAIHKMVFARGGIWIAAERGVFLLDSAGGALKKLAWSAEAAYINAAAAGDDVWFASAESWLLHVTFPPSGGIAVERSDALPFRTLAEMSAAGRTLWLLGGGRYGGDYKLAFLKAGQSELNILPGKYHALQNSAGRVLARHYSTLFEIGPDSATMTRIDLDERNLLSRSVRESQILFVGLSYNYKDGCEIVERGRFDISKGWGNSLPGAATASLSP